MLIPIPYLMKGELELHRGLDCLAATINSLKTINTSYCFYSQIFNKLVIMILACRARPFFLRLHS